MSDTAPSNGTTESARTRRRNGRGLGPFSGGQLTIIIVTVAVMLLFPVGAWALSFSNVSIIDPGGVHRATVNASGQLSTSAVVTGSVTATPTAPNIAYNNVTEVGDTDCDVLTPTVPAGKVLVVTSVTVAVTGGPQTPVTVNLLPTTPACNFLGSSADVWVLPGLSAAAIPFPQGYALEVGHVLSIGLTVDGPGLEAFVTVKGYLVASTLCTVTGPPVGCH